MKLSRFTYVICNLLVKGQADYTIPNIIDISFQIKINSQLSVIPKGMFLIIHVLIRYVLIIFNLS